MNDTSDIYCICKIYNTFQFSLFVMWLQFHCDSILFFLLMLIIISLCESFGFTLWWKTNLSHFHFLQLETIVKLLLKTVNNITKNIRLVCPIEMLVFNEFCCILILLIFFRLGKSWFLDLQGFALLFILFIYLLVLL